MESWIGEKGLEIDVSSLAVSLYWWKSFACSFSSTGFCPKIINRAENAGKRLALISISKPVWLPIPALALMKAWILDPPAVDGMAATWWKIISYQWRVSSLTEPEKPLVSALVGQLDFRVKSPQAMHFHTVLEREYIVTLNENSLDNWGKWVIGFIKHIVWCGCNPQCPQVWTKSSWSHKISIASLIRGGEV